MTIHSTDSFDSGKFSLHGSIEFFVSEDGIVHYSAKGPFNEELIVALFSIREDKLAEVYKTYPNWCELVEFQESCLATQALLSKFTIFLQSMKGTHLEPSATAFIIAPEIEGRNIMLGLYPLCYEAADIPFKIFETEAEARSWLAEKTG
ncbi:hypothetical protein [Neptunicella sp.]|uniref:hypothetical protein n=1 Tax=Neptunicella sp. TaxID=2125986 RepID=UPI003F68BCDF